MKNRERTRSGLILLVLLVGLLVRPAPSVRAAASLGLYGTFHAMGIVVTLDGSDDPDGDATASVAYRVSGSGTYRQGFPLSRVAATGGGFMQTASVRLLVGGSHVYLPIVLRD